MNDLEKFKQLFDDLNIQYVIFNEKLLIDSHIVEERGSYGKSLDLCFSRDGKFIGFDPFGE